MTQVVKIALEEEWGKRSETTPHLYIRADEAEIGLNEDTQTMTGGSKSIQRARKGYMEPEGSFSTTVDTKIMSTLLYYLMGNYKYTKGAGEEKNKHEFWCSDKTRLPSFTGTVCYDVGDQVVEKPALGVVLDEFELELGEDLATAKNSLIYKTEKARQISQDAQTIQDLNGIPFIGYDCTVTLDGVSSYVFTELKFSQKNNHQTDNCRGLGSRSYGIQPNTGDREIELELTTIFSLENITKIIESDYGELITDDDGYWIPSKCKLKTMPVQIKLQTCEDATEYVTFIFPNCLVEVDPLSYKGSDDIEVKLTLTAMGNKTVKLNDGTTTKKTDFYAIVVNDQENVDRKVTGGAGGG